MNPQVFRKQMKILVSLASILVKIYSSLFIICSTLACEDQDLRTNLSSIDQGIDSESWWYDDTFNDHTAQQLLSRSDFQALAKNSAGIQVLKFWLSEPQSGYPEGWSEQGLIRYYDSQFYTLHDQLYWFRLLNGVPVWTFETIPLEPPLEIYTIEALTQKMNHWEVAGKSLPLSLIFTESRRLYAPQFYEAMLNHPRRSIAGSIIHMDPHPERNQGQDLWAFELEYSDKPTMIELMSLFAYFRAHLPEGMKALKWLTRSPYQAELATQLIIQDQSYRDYILSYDDLVIAGEASIYSEGITAGRLHLLDDIQEDTKEREILIYQALPDELPACRALMSTIPQTPLAHLNLLARNRGIPNLYVGGLGQDPTISQLSRVRAPVLLWAQGSAAWRLLPLTSGEYTRYINLKTKPERSISRPPVEDSPYWLSDDPLSVDNLLDLRPLIGGKASGVLVIEQVLRSNEREIDSGTEDTRETDTHDNSETAITSPLPLFVLSGRAYAEHLQEIEATLRPLLNNPDVIKQRTRLILLLEGWQGIWQRGFDYETHESLRAWLEQESNDTQGLILSGGLQAWIRNKVLDTQVLRNLLEQLKIRFESVSPYQGLRIRSSSNIEDLEGFNGAGLYGSFTAYLYPQHQSNPSQQTKTIPSALKALWASYWNVEAVEERELEGIDHLSGWMAALIHPNFQDELELSNGVMTVTLMPHSPRDRGHLFFDQDWADIPIAVVTLNSQLGSESVTNPSSPELLTEIVEVQIYQAPDQTGPRLTVTRKQTSSLSTEVLSLQSIRQLSLQALKITQAWRQSDLHRLDYTQHYQAFTLDLEYREMEKNWPLQRESQNEILLNSSSQIVFKQARPLEPMPQNLPNLVKAAAFPLDLQRRSLRVRRWSCQSESVEINALQLYSDPLSVPTVGFETRPFTAEISYTDHRPEARNPSSSYRLTHRDYLVLQSSDYASEQYQNWQLELYRRMDRDLPFEHIKIDQQQGVILWTARNQDGAVIAPRQERVICESETVFSSPKDYLLSLLAQARLEGRGFGSE